MPTLLRNRERTMRERFRVKIWDGQGTKVLDYEPEDLKEFMERVKTVRKKYG